MVDDLVDVELDDELDGSAWASRTPRRPWTVRAWCRLAAALAVVVAAGAVQDGARAASVAELTAQAARDLRVERVARWSVHGQLVGVAGDTVLVSGGDTLTALRWVDGLWQWRAQGVADCALVALGDAAAAAAPAEGTAPGRSRVVCSVVGTGQGDSSGVAVLDPADGRWLLDQPAVAGEPTDWATESGRLYTVRGAAAGGEPGETTAVDLATGVTAWRTALARPLNGWYLTDEWLVLQGERTAIELTTGREGEPVSWGGQVRYALAGGGTAVSGWDTDGSLVGTSVLDAAGQALWRRQAYYAPPALTLDSSVLPVITLAGTLAGLDTRTGEQLWSGALPGPLLAAVDGVLVCAESVTTPVRGGTTPATDWVGLDLHTGAVLWQFRADGAHRAAQGMATDGRRFAVGGPAGVEIRDLRTGEVVGRWDTGVTQPSTVVPLTDGRVAQVTADSVAVLGP